MRISDWSSDVCSSDLGAGNTLLSDRGRDEREHSVVQGHLDVVPLPHADVERVRRDWLHWPPVRGGDGHLVSTHGDGTDGVATGDRKSVVSGKSVEVGVDLGGRRVINKKRMKIE